MNVNPVEAIWLLVTVSAMLLTWENLIEANRSWRAVRHTARVREIQARANLRREIVRLVINTSLLVLVIPVAFGGTTSDPGITPTTIHIGGTAPLTGVAQGFRSVAEGANAYFKYVNARGGVNKRKINYEYVDDQYIPSETVRATRDLVENKDVFVIFNSLGTEQNEAIRPYLNQKQVPQLFAATGATEFGRDYRQYPWSIAYQPTYMSEGAMYGTYIRRTMPRAKIADRKSVV